MAPTPDDDRPAGRAWVSSGDPGSSTSGPPSDETSREVAGLQAAARSRRDDSDDDGDSLLSFLKELPVLLLIAFGLAFLLRTFVVQVFFIPSESMVPTLAVDDRIVVEKISYRFGGPSRGDVVVFAGESSVPEPPQNGIQQVVRGVGQFLGVVPVDARDLVKRVIGLPGDRVELEDGQVIVNGVPIDEPYAQLDSDNGLFTVPEGKLFVLGDNRRNSADSRSQLGYVDVDDVVGRAVLTIWPLDRMGSIAGGDYPDLEAGSREVPDDGTPEAVPLAAVPVLGYVVRRDAPSRHDDVLTPSGTRA